MLPFSVAWISIWAPLHRGLRLMENHHEGDISAIFYCAE